MMNNVLRIATRHSTLALWQAHYVTKLLQEHNPSLTVQLIKITTQGDKDQSRALSETGGKSLFVKELQHALLENKADIAVHCVKDMSAEEHSKLVLGAILKRDDASDIFSSHQCQHIEQLEAGSVIGTASPRRQALVKNLYPQLHLKLLRGNIDTRLNKLDAGEYDAILLAAAGLKRLGYLERIQSQLDKEIFVPAIGQGALAIECLATRHDVLELVKPLHHPKTAICIESERVVNRTLNGSCFTPLGAYATLTDKALQLSAFVGSLDGRTIIRSTQSGSVEAPRALGLDVANDLIAQGALTLLKDI